MAPFQWTDTNFVLALRDMVGDPSSGAATRWTDAEMARYGNRGGQQLVLSIPELFQTTWTVALADGTNEYLLPAAFVADRRVEYEYTSSDIRTLTYVTQEQWQRYRLNADPTDKGEPHVYTYWRKLQGTETAEKPPYLTLHPTPGTEEDTKTLRIYGYKTPDTIASSPGSNVLETPAIYVEAQLAWAAYLIKRDDGETGEADRFRAEFEAQVAKIRSAEYTMSRQGNPKIRPRDSIFTIRRPIPPQYRGYY